MSRSTASPSTRRSQTRRRKKRMSWFALNDDRPLCAFAGIWTNFNGDRGTKSKPVPGPHHARFPKWVKRRNVRCEPMSSALHLKADSRRTWRGGPLRATSELMHRSTSWAGGLPHLPRTTDIARVRLMTIDGIAHRRSAKSKQKGRPEGGPSLLGSFGFLSKQSREEKFASAQCVKLGLSEHKPIIVIQSNDHVTALLGAMGP